MMRQLAAIQVQGHGAETVVWARSRAELARLIASDTLAPDTMLFLDEVLPSADDPLWEQLADNVESGRLRGVIIASIDRPPAEFRNRLQPHIMDESDLRFSADELEEFAQNAPARAPADLMPTLHAQLKGHAGLVSMHIQRLASSAETGIWVSPDAPLIVELEQHIFGMATESDSVLLSLLLKCRWVRVITVSVMAMLAPELTPQDRNIYFDRLRNLPMLAEGTDEETGEASLTWQERAWERALAGVADDVRRRNIANSLAIVTNTGRVVAPLVYLLSLGDYKNANALVHSHVREFQLFSDASTTSALHVISDADLEGHPALQILSADQRQRAEGVNRTSIERFRSALKALSDTPLHGGHRTLVTLCWTAYAAASAGNRSALNRALTRIEELTDPEEGLALGAGLDRPARNEVSAALYLAYWSAIQADQHDLALRLAEQLTVLRPSSDRVGAIELYALATEREFVGISLSGLDDQLQAVSQASALSLLERGRDAEARRFVEPLVSHVLAAYSRSAMDGLVVLIDALAVDPCESLHLGGRLLERSRQHWGDGSVGTFLAFATVVESLRQGEPEQARENVAGLNADAFVQLAHALIELSTGQYAAAIEAAETVAQRSSMPRFRVLAHTLAAAGFVKAGNLSAALGRMSKSWGEDPEPALHRFALRFVTEDVCVAFDAAHDKLPASLHAVIADARDDRRMPELMPKVTLRPSEIEVLRLLRAGMTNQEIADARFVSLNTVRSQIKRINRTLNATTREAAIAAAEELRLI